VQAPDKLPNSSSPGWKVHGDDSCRWKTPNLLETDIHLPRTAQLYLYQASKSATPLWTPKSSFSQGETTYRLDKALWKVQQ